MLATRVSSCLCKAILCDRWSILKRYVALGLKYSSGRGLIVAKFRRILLGLTSDCRHPDLDHLRDTSVNIEWQVETVARKFLG